jgi:F-type H+-transporting ATPase subunit b
MPVFSGCACLLFAEASSAAPNPLSVSVDLALFSLIAFAILFLLLLKFAWKPIMDGLENRENMIAHQIEAAEQGAKQSAALLAEYEAKIGKAGEDAARLIAEAKKDAESAKEKIMAEAAAEAERQRQRAITDIQNAKDAAMQELTQRGVDSAVALAGSLIGKEVDANLHEKLIKDSLAKFSNRN